MQRTFISETPKFVGQEVRLCGWVQTIREHGKLIFLDLRDWSGVVQVVCPADFAELEKVKRLSVESTVSIVGQVRERPQAMVNPQLATGKIEVILEQVEVLGRAKALPFDVLSDGREIAEEKRLEYRYLDLRRPRLQANLRLRQRVIKYLRDFLTERGFIEIETPILTKATPEGARDYLVPSRLYPAKFYALPQSPQQYKQLLQVSGFERYFQIARCFRDEDTRGDRQPEFTQLDIEMSFVSQEEILNLVEELFIKITEEVAGKKVYQKPFPRLTHSEAVSRFGQDKFDLRSKKDDNVLAFAWVLDFPLLEKTETKEIAPAHHPFTAAKDEDQDLLFSKKREDWLKIRSWQHDLVCNGYEIGGGSLRITDPKIQSRVFEILGHSPEETNRKFGHLLRAFEYGVPPHGGIAPGIDRFLMLLAGEPNIREVIAFPKTGDARDLMMNVPSEASEKQLADLGIGFRRKKKQ